MRAWLSWPPWWILALGPLLATQTFADRISIEVTDPIVLSGSLTAAGGSFSVSNEMDDGTQTLSCTYTMVVKAKGRKGVPTDATGISPGCSPGTIPSLTVAGSPVTVTFASTFSSLPSDTRSIRVIITVNCDGVVKTVKESFDIVSAFDVLFHIAEDQR